MPTDIWSYRSDVFGGGVATFTDITGFSVEALDGGIGHVDEATDEVGAGYIVVDTGPWIFGKKVMLPAGTVQHIDIADRKVYVSRTKDQIKGAPQYDDTYGDDAYRTQLGSYYGRGGVGWRDDIFPWSAWGPF